ncbi:MAG TPA: transcription elongation factor GreB [Gammaproteobacteria bacterium]|nr:transcription elongation factor GreB [Gammaproteobacteria bacterium]
MGRWRPPTSQSSPYITAEGYQALQAELRGLWERRAEVTRHLAAAAVEGDRSENAEYIYRKKELREIDRRIRYLQKRLPLLKVIARTPADMERVYFGAWVTLEAEDGSTTVYRIVGADETRDGENYLSVDSPLARQLLKKSPGEALMVKTARMTRRYLLMDIGYQPPPAKAG